MVPIAEDFADGFVALVKILNWTRVAVLSYDEDFVFNVKFLCCMFVTKCSIITSNYCLKYVCMITKLTCYTETCSRNLCVRIIKLHNSTSIIQYNVYIIFALVHVLNSDLAATLKIFV